MVMDGGAVVGVMVEMTAGVVVVGRMDVELVERIEVVGGVVIVVEEEEEVVEVVGGGGGEVELVVGGGCGAVVVGVDDTAVVGGTVGDGAGEGEPGDGTGGGTHRQLQCGEIETRARTRYRRAGAARARRAGPQSTSDGQGGYQAHSGDGAGGRCGGRGGGWSGRRATNWIDTTSNEDGVSSDPSGSWGSGTYLST